MPAIIERLGQKFRNLNTDINPFTAVTAGATVMCATLCKCEGVKDFIVSDVLPMSIGFQKLDNSVRSIFRKGTTIPEEVELEIET